MNIETEFRGLIAERSKLRCTVTATGPKWGGSFEVSDEYAWRRSVEINSRLAVLRMQIYETHGAKTLARIEATQCDTPS